MEVYLLLQGFIPTWSAPSPPVARSVSGYSKEQRTQTFVTLLQRRRTQHQLCCQYECHTDHRQLRKIYLFAEDVEDADDNNRMAVGSLSILANSISFQLVSRLA